jgi:transposase
VEQIRDRVAALDVHRDSVAACARVPGPRGGVRLDKDRFATTTAGVAQLAAWLAERGVTTVGMEATGVYWRPVVRHEVPRIRAEVKGLRLRPVAAGR